jgi:hypothetical protein
MMNFKGSRKGGRGMLKELFHNLSAGTERSLEYLCRIVHLSTKNRILNLDDIDKSATTQTRHLVGMRRSV